MKNISNLTAQIILDDLLAISTHKFSIEGKIKNLSPELCAELTKLIIDKMENEKNLSMLTVAKLKHILLKLMQKDIFDEKPLSIYDR